MGAGLLRLVWRFPGMEFESIQARLQSAFARHPRETRFLRRYGSILKDTALGIGLVILMFYAVSDFDSRATLRMLRHSGFECIVREAGLAWGWSWIEIYFLSVPLESWIDLTDARHVESQVVLTEVWHSWLEYKTAEWAREMNDDLGIAPSSDDVLQKHDEFNAQVPREVRNPPRGNLSRVHGRVWVSRWRERWGAILSTIPAGDQASTEIILQKAWVVFGDPPWVFQGITFDSLQGWGFQFRGWEKRDMGCFFGPLNMVKLYQFLAPNCGPPLGPHSGAIFSIPVGI